MRVLITDRFAPEGVERLRSAGLEVVDSPGLAGEALHAAIAQVHALIVRSVTPVDAALVERAKALLVVGRAGVGYENIDAAACAKAGIAVMNTPGASAITTAERTLALIFALLHQVAAADRSVRAGKWERRSFMATELFGKTLGVLGYGNIGRVVAARSQALGMRVLVHDPHVPPENAFNLGHTPVGFDALFTGADVVTCHVSADLKLKGLVGARELGLMRPGTWLINASRGFIVDEAALVEALKSGRLKGAALDVFEREPLPADSPLRALDNVVFSPHLGASSTEAERRVSISVAEQVARFLAEGVASNLVVPVSG
jgi:D-3-phosphoglycerate dehydrogenase / 2-oxoglutarate reductase